jgi:hypothetical protein
MRSIHDRGAGGAGIVRYRTVASDKIAIVFHLMFSGAAIAAAGATLSSFPQPQSAIAGCAAPGLV